MTCNETDGARNCRRWRYYRPTWPHLEGPSRPKSTYSTRLAGLTTCTCSNTQSITSEVRDVIQTTGLPDATTNRPRNRKKWRNQTLRLQRWDLTSQRKWTKTDNKSQIETRKNCNCTGPNTNKDPVMVINPAWSCQRYLLLWSFNCFASVSLHRWYSSTLDCTCYNLHNTSIGIVWGWKCFKRRALMKRSRMFIKCHDARFTSVDLEPGGEMIITA